MKYIFFLPLVLVLAACGESQKTEDPVANDESAIEYFGNTQGTTYAVIVNDDIDLTMGEIESTLNDFDLALSSYIPNSAITQINESQPGPIFFKDEQNYFSRCYDEAYEVFKLSRGNFDPTVYPLVDGWGFMKEIENVPDSAVIDSLRALVGFQKNHHFMTLSEARYNDTGDSTWLIKVTPGAKLDFNAIAQGMAVDVLAELIESKGGENYFVEIGGEIRVKGKNKEGSFWRIGIDKPFEGSNEETREIQEIVQLNNKSIATSGSYRKFYEKDGEKYSHTLDPFTGYPVKHKLLSATVVADNCAYADAMATALMVMGPERGIAYVDTTKNLDIEVYLIFENTSGRMETFYTKGFGELITE